MYLIVSPVGTTKSRWHSRVVGVCECCFQLSGGEFRLYLEVLGVFLVEMMAVVLIEALGCCCRGGMLFRFQGCPGCSEMLLGFGAFLCQDDSFGS